MKKINYERWPILTYCFKERYWKTSAWFSGMLSYLTDKPLKIRSLHNLWRVDYWLQCLFMDIS